MVTSKGGHLWGHLWYPCLSQIKQPCALASLCPMRGVTETRMAPCKYRPDLKSSSLRQVHALKQFQLSTVARTRTQKTSPRIDLRLFHSSNPNSRPQAPSYESRVDGGASLAALGRSRQMGDDSPMPSARGLLDSGIFLLWEGEHMAAKGEP